MPHDAELLIAYPPPRTPNFPPTAGNARIAIAALPPLRLRSSPHPHRMSAGELRRVELRDLLRGSPDRTPATSAARSKVHSCRAFAEAFGAERVIAQERLIGAASLRTDNGEPPERPPTSLPGLNGEMKVGRSRERGSPRVDRRPAWRPRFCASRTYGTMWMPVADGLIPQSTISAACG